MAMTNPYDANETEYEHIHAKRIGVGKRFLNKDEMESRRSEETTHQLVGVFP